jgi:hypothetical protein
MKESTTEKLNEMSLIGLAALSVLENLKSDDANNPSS